MCNRESCTQSDPLSVCFSLCPRRGLRIYTARVHERQRQSRSESVYLFWRRLRTRVSLRRCARAALAVVCFERRGRGASAAGKQTSKNICSPLLEDEQSQSYIYPGRGDEKLFSYGRLNVPMLLPAFKGKRGSALEVMSYSWVVTRNLDAPHN